MASEASSSWQRTGKNIPRVRHLCCMVPVRLAAHVTMHRLSLLRSLTKPVCFGARVLLPIHPSPGLTCCCVLSCAVVLPEAVHSQVSADGSSIVGRDGIHSSAFRGAGECLMCCRRTIRADYVHSIVYRRVGLVITAVVQLLLPLLRSQLVPWQMSACYCQHGQSLRLSVRSHSTGSTRTSSTRRHQRRKKMRAARRPLRVENSVWAGQTAGRRRSGSSR